MSVLPLNPEGTSPSVLEDPQQFHAAVQQGRSVILVQNLQRTQLSSTSPSEPLKSGNVSYDLRVGGKYRDHRDDEPVSLSGDEVIELLPGAAVIIKTEEEVEFSPMTFGVIVPKVGLLQLGVSNTTSKVDPGYRGPLLITAFNLGKRPVPLKRGDPFCSMYVLTVQAGAKAYTGKGKDLDGLGKRPFWRTVRDRIEANGATIGIVAIIVTIASNLLTFWLAVGKPK